MKIMIAALLCCALPMPAPARESRTVVATVGDASLAAVLASEAAAIRKALATEETPPYFIAFSVYEVETYDIVAGFGALTSSSGGRNRTLVIDVRVGDYELDNTHPVRGDDAGGDGGFGWETMPLEDDDYAIRMTLWRETEKVYRDAVEALARARANRDVKVEEEDQSPDFSKEKAITRSEAAVKMSIDVNAWEQRLRQLSARFRDDPKALAGDAGLRIRNTRRTIVNSEGSTLITSDSSAKAWLSASMVADDGMHLSRYESWFAFQPADLPPDDILSPTGERMLKELEALRAAPLMEPYTGPAILVGRSAGVFFHEIFGHRIEGHRQRDESEGQTFKKLIGEPVLPEFINVTFDPTRTRVGETMVAGHYRFDDEGVAARPVHLVENGVLRAFLMSRQPVEGFPVSNGHGRAQVGRRPVGRQSNLIVEASTSSTEAELRLRLRTEAKAQGKAFGLLIADISGGFTFTGRSTPNSFAVQPQLVYKVFVDDRPDEVVRGVDLIGTPLTAFSKIIAAGDRVETFNGECGAESGWVPVSASSPSLLISQIEVQKTDKSPDRPPLLPAPPLTAGSAR